MSAEEGSRPLSILRKKKSKYDKKSGADNDHAISMVDIQPDMNGNRSFRNTDEDVESKNVTARKSVLGTIAARSRRPNTMRPSHHPLVITGDDGTEDMVARVTDTGDLKDNNKVQKIRRAKSLIIEDEDAKLKTIPQSLEEMTDMAHLSIKMSRIKKIPEPVVARKNLKSLHISETPLVNMEGVCRMVQLQELELTGNKIALMPRNITNLNDLRVLDLSGNHIVTVIPEIGQLKSLKRLYLTANKIMKLPEEVCGLATLEVLDISRNKLTEFPQNLGSLSKLVELTASHNKIGSFPDSMKSLTSLKHLAMTKNIVAGIPAFFNQLESLTHVSLNQNKVQAILSLPPKIESLLLDGNNVEDIDALITFTGAATLKVLSLRETPIKRLPEAMKSFPHLHALYLDGSQVDYLPDDLQNLQEMRHLSLHNTKIRALPGGFQKGRLSVFIMDNDEVLGDDPEGQT